MRTFKRALPLALAVILAGAVAIGCSADAKKARVLKRANDYFDSGDYDKAKIEYLNVLRADPQNATAIQRLGTIWYEQGAPLRALPFLLKTRELLPNHTDSRTKLALVFLSAGQFVEARKEADAILERSPGDEEAMLILVESARSQQELDQVEKQTTGLNTGDKAGFHLARAALALRKKDLASAAKEAKQAVSVDPSSAKAHLVLARLYWATNDLSNADREFKAATELSSIRSPEYWTYAEFKMRTGAADEAKALLRNIVQKAPDSLQALRMLAQIALAEKQFDESLTLIESILFRDPGNVEGRLLQAQVWLAKGETKRALESLENLSNSLPKVPAIKYDLARAYLQDGKPAQAAASLKEAIAVYPDYTEAILLLGEVNLRSRNSQEAIASMLDLLKKRPGLIPAQLVLAEAYMAQGQENDAIALIREQIKASPKDPRGHLRLGLILRRLGKFKEARKAFEDAEEIAPEHVMAINQLVELDVQNKDFGAATQRVQALVHKTPQSSVAHFLEGKVYAAQGEWDSAKSALTKALELDANFPEAYDLLISTYMATNDLPQAIENLKALLSKDVKNARALMLSALIYEKMNDFSKAREAYEKLLSVDPDFAPALNNLAYLYLERLNDLNKAYELARKARSLRPSDPAIADTLGWVLYKRAEYQQALTLLQESAQNLPTNPEIQFHLGMASYMMGRMDEARTAFRQAAEASVSFPDKEEAKRRLSLLGDSGSQTKHVSSNEVPLNEQSEDPFAQVRLGESYEKQGAFAQAAASYEKAIQLNPNLLSANVQLARLYAGPLQDANKGLKFAKKARELAPNDPKIIGILGGAAYQTGNFSWAYSLLQESAGQLTNDARVLLDLAWSAYSLGRVDEARQVMQRVLTAAPNSSQSSDANLFLEMVSLSEEGANPVSAQARVEQVLKAKPDYVPALMARAMTLLQNGDSPAAATAFSDVLRRFPDFAPAQKHLASLYADNTEKRNQAYDLVMKARKGLPDDPELARLLAELSYQRKEYAYALQLLQESAKKRPLDAESLYYLGMAYWQAKQPAESENALQRALTAGLREPLSTDAKRVLTQLREN